MICVSGGSKSRLAKAAGAEPAGQMRDEKLHAVVARSTMYKTHNSRTTFGGSDVEKVHAVVARSTFRSQNVENAPAPDHFYFEVKMYKTPGVRTTFGGSDVTSHGRRKGLCTLSKVSKT